MSLDSGPIEVGKLQDGYLTDERGRRVYFPAFGPARLIPSRDEEAKFRERVSFATMAGPAWYAIGYGLKIFWLDDIVPRFVVDSLFLLSLVALWVGGFVCVELLARRWEPVPESVQSPSGYVLGALVRQSLPALWRMAVLRLLGLLCVAALGAMSLAHPDFHLASATPLEWSLRLPLLLLALAILALVGRSWWCAVRALAERLGEKSQA